MIWLLHKYNNSNQAVTRSYIKNLKNLLKNFILNHNKPLWTQVYFMH